MNPSTNLVANDDVFHFTARADSALRRALNQRLSNVLGISYAQASAIAQLMERAPLLCRELADRQCVDASATSRLLSGLEKKGVILRQRVAYDRRVVRPCLTPVGQALAARIPEVLQTAERAFLAVLTQTERECLRSLLGRMLNIGGTQNRAPVVLPSIR